MGRTGTTRSRRRAAVRKIIAPAKSRVKKWIEAGGAVGGGIKAVGSKLPPLRLKGRPVGSDTGMLSRPAYKKPPMTQLEKDFRKVNAKIKADKATKKPTKRRKKKKL